MKRSSDSRMLGCSCRHGTYKGGSNGSKRRITLRCTLRDFALPRSSQSCNIGTDLYPQAHPGLPCPVIGIGGHHQLAIYLPARLPGIKRHLAIDLAQPRRPQTLDTIAALKPASAAAPRSVGSLDSIVARPSFLVPTPGLSIGALTTAATTSRLAQHPSVSAGQHV
jgi:hypothetical protein